MRKEENIQLAAVLFHWAPQAKVFDSVIASSLGKNGCLHHDPGYVREILFDGRLASSVC